MSAIFPMSDREWHFYVDDMIGFAERATMYPAGMQQSEFQSNALVRDATLRNLELIGEAALHIPQAIRDSSPKIPWRQIIATRNRLIHGYLGIDDDTIWSIIRDDLPPLLAALRAIRGMLNQLGSPSTS